MKKLKRRRFLKQTAALASTFVLPRRARAAVESRIEVIMDEPVGTISPDIYGHFTEHIGGVVYDGIWVGEDSAIPNYGGVRKELVDHMKRLKPSVVRWPGGCFADSYNWRDGIGPRAERPRRPNFWIYSDFLRKADAEKQMYEPNHFGTHEFIHFCRLIGAEPYLAANVRTQTPLDFNDWVDYCNAPTGTTTLAEQRETNGSKDPFDVRFWGVGNESWGCGGGFTPREYAAEFIRFISWAPYFGTTPLSHIAAGPNGGEPGGDLDWTRDFFARLVERGPGYLNRMYGWALHYYCGTSGKGQALDFTENDWYTLLHRADRMEKLILDHWAIMGEYDKRHRVKFVVDEWGAWHRPGSEADPSHLFGQTSTMRDALISALTLDIFNRHADKVAMANVAQLINNLHSLFLAHEEHFTATPNFHVFEMYSAHHKGKSLRTVFTAPEIGFDPQNKKAKLWGLAGSASLHDKQLVLSVVNPSVDEARETEIDVRGATIVTGEASTLAEDDIHAHNSFDHPNAVTPAESALNVKNGSVVHAFPPASVSLLTLDLA